MTAYDRVLVLADDLTGALEAGATFAHEGTQALIKADPSSSLAEMIQAAPVLVIDTETRHLPSGDARQKIYGWALDARALDFQFIYKKTDSTLRGNIASELGALLSAFPGERLLYVPAYPLMGRTVKRGRLHVDGAPVSDTAFGQDALNPVRESHIPSLLAGHCPVVSLKPNSLSEHSEAAVYVCEGESEVEVRTAVRFFISSETIRLAAGPTAFLRHFAQMAELGRSQPAPLPGAASALVVNGSRHEASLRQLEFAAKNGFLTLDPAAVDARLSASAWSILKPLSEPEMEPPRRLAGRQAETVLNILRRVPLDALIVFGGDTAYAVLQTLGNPAIRPIGHLIEGIPISGIDAESLGPVMGNRQSDLLLITKAGGFGSADVLPLLRKALSGRSS
jgi:uncharacterized protein YgbK (DUF1537 family)